MAEGGDTAGTVSQVQRTRDSKVLLICFLLIASTVSWRHKAYFTGSIDIVVLLKGVLSLVGLILSASLLARGSRFQLGTRSSWLLGLLLTASFFGGWSSGSTFASIVLIARIAMLAITVFLMLRTVEHETVIRSLVTVMLAFAMVSALSGARSLGATGSRLGGGIPPCTPNELAFLCAIPLIAIGWLAITRQTTNGRRDLVLVVSLFAIIWLTGSRTGLVAVILALVVMLLQVRRMSPSMLITVLMAVPAVVYVMASGVVSSFIDRGGSANISTLSQRTVAWNAALHLHKQFWDTWFGGGLSTKVIPVVAQYRTSQILDSSWISALVQAGLVGIVLLGALAVLALLSATFTDRPQRLLWTGLLVFLLVRSYLESGLIDSSPAFIVFFAVSTLVEKGSRRQARPADRVRHQLAPITA